MSSTALADSIADGSALEVSNLFNVDGWVAVVTGGGTGLGLVTATTLARNGCTVYITGRRGDVLEKAVESIRLKNGKGKVIAIQADVSTKEGINKLQSAVAEKEKYINLLVNNHGVSMAAADIDACEQTPEGLSKKMFEEESFETWLDTYKINTASYHFTAFAFLPLLCAAKFIGGAPEPGNIITIASMSGITLTSQRGQFNYNASKAATISLALQQATEFARRNLGVRVNIINPGYFPSGMTIVETKDDQSSEQLFNHFRKEWGVPFGRPGNAVDYAQTILSIARNQYMTGAQITIDGGWLLEMGKFELDIIGKGRGC